MKMTVIMTINSVLRIIYCVVRKCLYVKNVENIKLIRYGMVIFYGKWSYERLFKLIELYKDYQKMTELKEKY